jgi:hypothetical protein
MTLSQDIKDRVPDIILSRAPDDVVKTYFSHYFQGKTMEWEKSGRGAGTYARGEILMFVPGGVTNEEALDILQTYRTDLVIRPSYCKFGMQSSQNDRFMVAVLNENRKQKRRAKYDFYAPNKQDVYRPG